MSILDHTDNSGLLGEMAHIKAEKENVQDKHKISCNGKEKKSAQKIRYQETNLTKEVQDLYT